MIKITDKDKIKIWESRYKGKENARCRCLMPMKKANLRTNTSNLNKKEEKGSWDIGYKIGKSKSNIHGHSNLRPLCVRCLRRTNKN